MQGKKDISLNNAGKIQARECRKILKDMHWDIIIASPLQRAKQTAEIIKAKMDVPFIEMREFEEKGYGSAEGLLPEDRKKLFPDNIYPEQENQHALIKRIMAGIDAINRHYKGKKVLLVTHGDVISTIITELSHNKMNCNTLKLVNGSISNIEYMQNEWKVISINQIRHLSAYRA